jgi:putative metalloprotease
MIALTPLLIAIASALVMYQVSIWRTARTLDANSVPLTDPTLAPILGRLARALGLSSLDVHLYEIAPINGLAAPDGRIFITRGLYDRFRTGEIEAEELASVVAHEVGHVALGHARRRQIDFTGQNAIRVALAAILGRYVPGFGMMIANALAQLLSAKLSRQDEFQADAYAAALMVKGRLPRLSVIRGRQVEEMPAAGGVVVNQERATAPQHDRVRSAAGIGQGRGSHGRPFRPGVPHPGLGEPALAGTT